MSSDDRHTDSVNVTPGDLVAVVRAYAQEHYDEGGWDFVVETWQDEDIVEVIGDAKTPAEAIARVADDLKPHTDISKY